MSTPSEEPPKDAAEWLRLKRRLLPAVTAVLILIAGALTLALRLAARPRPRTLTWTVSAPAATPLKDGARPEPLRVEFSDSAAKLEDAGRPVKRGVALRPFARGTWAWESDRVLAFAPSEDWPAGQEYSVRLDPALLPAHVRADALARTFATAPFTAAVASIEFQVDPRDPRIKRVAATLRFSHPVDPDALEKRLSMALLLPKTGLFDSGRAPQKFAVTYDKFRGEAYVVSDPIPIPAEAANLELRVAAGVTPRRGGPATREDLASPVRVPGMFDYFRIESAAVALTRNERLEPEQALIVTASADAEETAMADAVRAWVLPSTRPAAPDRTPEPDYRWEDPSEVGPETLAVSTPVVLTPIPAEREHPSRHAFRLRAPPGAALYVRVPKGVAGYGGYALAREFDAVARAPEFPREVKLLHQGAVLRLSGDKRLSLYALGERAVRLEVERVRPGELAHLASQTEGDFASPRFKSWSFGPDDISERFEEVRTLAPGAPDKLQFLSFDLGKLLSGPGSGSRDGFFFVRAEGWNAKKKKPTGSSDSRFVLVTDLGVLVKENADKTRDVFVQSLADGAPAAGARVEAVGLNGLTTVTALTDATGRARLPDLTGRKREKKPAAVVVRKGEDVSFLPFDREDRRLDDSRFDVGGDVTGGRERELTAYLFSDRGLYRPGETFHAGILVRPEVWGQDLTGVPLEVAVEDPRGMEVKKEKLALGAAGFESVSYQTQENGPTGAFQICVYIVKDGRRGNLLGSTSVRVEEFLPDRLRIEARFSDDRADGWVSPKNLKASVSLRTLFGTPAQNRKITATIRLTPAAPSFKDYPDYAFFDPARAKKTFSDRLDDAQTDLEGAATLDLPLDKFAAGTYRLDFLVEGFEADGGRGVSAQASTIVSPRPYLVGFKPDGALNYVTKGSTRSVTAVAVGPDGRALAVSSVSASLIEERWVSALIKGPDGLYRYQSTKKEVFVSSRTMNLPARPTSLKLDTSKPGDYAVVIRDAAGEELNQAHFSVAGRGNLSRSLEKNAELQVKLNRADYAPGDAAELMIKAPYAGAGLIAVERDKVYAHKWFRSSVAASTQSIRIPAGLEGNGYVTVTFLRAPDSKEIFMSPLSHGVAPFTVSRARRELAVRLDAPRNLKPGQTCVLRVVSPRRARVAVFAADEGILQAASWRAPDPLAHFLRKRALEVRTYQILDLLLPEYAVSMSVLAPGGDKGWDAAGKNLNPFKRRRDKPAVFWSGLLDVGPEGKSVSFVVPDSFNGTLRATAVAADADAVGVAEAKTLVRAAIVLTPSAPLFAAPGDEFEVGVSLANGVKGSGPKAKANVALKTTDHVEVLGERTHVIDAAEGREVSATFRLRAKQALGSADLVFEARISSETSKRAISVSIRPPTPYQVALTGGHSVSGRNMISTLRRMYPSYRTLEASVSPLPLVLAKGLLQYLDKYPYGCTEQVVSEAFPAVVLRRRPEFGYAPEIAETNFSRAIDVLRSRQNEDGAFGFWAANSRVSEFHSAYAAHFLLEAKEAGEPVPPDLLAKVLAHLEQVAAGAPGLEAPARVRAYAIYDLTRSGRVTTPLINGLRAELERSRDKTWRGDLTAAYLAASCAMLRLDGPADALIRGVPFDGPAEPDDEWFYDATVHRAQLLYLLARHFPRRLEEVDADAVQSLATALERGRYHSLAAAYAILALDAEAAAAGGFKPGDARAAEVRDDGERPLVLSNGLFAKAEFSPAAKAIAVENASGRPLFYQANQSGYDLETVPAPVKNGLEVEREILDEKNQPVSSAELGREYTVRLRVRATRARAVPNAAVVDLAPGGFEPVWTSRGEGGAQASDYQDVREDRVLFFLTAESGVRELTYKIRAAARGKFLLPPAYAESMYDRSVYAYGAPGSIEIK